MEPITLKLTPGEVTPIPDTDLQITAVAAEYDRITVTIEDLPIDEGSPDAND